MAVKETSWERLPDGAMLNERYRIVRALGKGGMGTVYLAQHLRLDTEVAVKEVQIPTSGSAEQDAGDLEAAENEAKMLVKLHHPHLPRVTDAFLENSRFYLVMEYIEGVTLETFLRGQERPHLGVRQVVEWGIQIAGVLDYLHAQKPAIIFRDLKPANIMLQPDGEIRLIDFGIARRFHPGAGKDTELLGSVGYSPPEQFGRKQTDMRSDIYSFGATLHHLLTGQDPAVTPFKFAPVVQFYPDVSLALSTLIADCVQIEPAQRPQNAKELLERLRTIRGELALKEALSGTLTPSSAVGITEFASAENRPVTASAALSSRSSLLPWAAGGFLAAAVVITSLFLALHHGPLKAAASPPAHTGIQVYPSQPPADTPSQGNAGGVSLPQAIPAVTQLVVRPAQSFPQLTTVNGVVCDPISISGQTMNCAGKNVFIALYFTDKNGNPLQPAVPNSSFTDAQGQLSVAQPVGIKSSDQSADLPFLATFPIPVNLFSSGTEDVQVTAKVMVEQQNIFSLTVPVPIIWAGTPQTTPQTDPTPSQNTAPPPAPVHQGGMGISGPVHGGN